MRAAKITRLLALVLATGLLAAPAAASGEEAAPTTSTATTTVEAAPAPPATTPAVEPIPTPQPEASTPQVQSQASQGSTPAESKRPAHEEPKQGAAAPSTTTVPPPRAKTHAPAPSTLTPSLPLALQSSLSGIPPFFIESFQVPPFLLPIYQAAGTAYGIPWQVLAAINEVETDYGRDLSVSSAGAEGWMQFLPSSWEQFGVDANGDGFKDPYNPADAIFAAARYLRAAGGDQSLRAAIYSYNHSSTYVESVMLRAQLLGGTPSELLGAITGLTEARFPVHAAAHFSDGFPTVGVGAGAHTVPGTTIYSSEGAPVIAVQDGEVVQIGNSPTLGRFVSLRDAFGNTYTYAELGSIASVYPVLQPRVHSAVPSQIVHLGAEPVPSGPATAGVQPRSPLSEGATVSGLALGAAAGLESAPSAPRPAPARPAPTVREFREGPNDVFLHPLTKGAQVIAGTVLGHVGSGEGGEPHIVFQVRPAGAGAPLIDPKPILDGWVALENSSTFHAKGENPFLATSPSVGQVLLESKQQLQPQVLHDAGIHLGRCGRQAVQSGRVDKRVLAALEYLSVSGLRPTVGGLPCARTATLAATNARPATDAVAVRIVAVNGTPLAGHQGPGTVADTTVRKLLMLQGLSRPRRIESQMSYPGSTVAVVNRRASAGIEVAFATPAGGLAYLAGVFASALAPAQWTKLIARLGQIPDPTVSHGHSSAAIPDQEAQAGGNR